MTAHYSCAELAAMNLPGYPKAKKNWIELVRRESWPSRPRTGRGGGYEYTPPAPILRLIRLKDRALEAIDAPACEQQILAALVSSLADIKARQAADESARKDQAEAILRDLAGLSERASLTLNARSEIARGWQVWFVQAQPMQRSASWLPYADAYNAREIPMAEAIREAFPQG